jgi:hypothetical protein
VEGCQQTENSINFSFKTTLKRKAPLPFSRPRASFTQFLLQPLTLLFIGGRLYGTQDSLVAKEPAYKLEQNFHETLTDPKPDYLEK